MKFLKPILLTFSVIFFFTSCSNEEASLTLKSNHFNFTTTQLNIVSKLGFNPDFESGFEQENNDITLAIIPCYLTSNSISQSSRTTGSTREDYLISIDNEIDQTAILIEADGTSSVLDTNFDNYTGTIKQTIVQDSDQEFAIEIDFKNGIVTAMRSNDLEKIDQSKDGCKTYRDVLVCTGEKFEKNCCGVEEILGCYGGFLFCYIYRQVDCFLDNCDSGL